MTPEADKDMASIIVDMAKDVGEVKGILSTFVDGQKTINDNLHTKMEGLEKRGVKTLLIALGGSATGGGVIHGLLKWLG